MPDTPVRQRSLRTHNLRLVLSQVAESPVVLSRADIASATGLTRATISSLVDELVAGRLLDEVAPVPRTGAGRPPIGLALSADGPAGLGLEVNVDYLAACLVDLRGSVRRHVHRPGDQRGRSPARVLAGVTELAAEMVAAAAVPVAGVALAVAGLVSDGVVRLAPNLGWRDVDAGSVLRADPVVGALGLSTVDNEANLAALGELHAWPDGPGRPSFLYVSGEVGVGAGVVLDGQLLRGARGFAGEFGHVTVRPDGPLCRCGSTGCLEAYVSSEAMLRDAGLERDAGAMARLAQLAGAGERRARAALTRAGATVGIAVAGVVNLLDLPTVVLGGAYAPLAPWLAGPLAREVTARVVASPWAPVTVRASTLDSTATVVGAAGSVVRAVLESPASWLGHPGPGGAFRPA